MRTKRAENLDYYKQNAEFTNSAREAWQLILETLSPSAKILLPSYIGVTDREGSGIYDSVTSLNIMHDFYILNSDLSISMSEIEKCLTTQRYDLILLVHYFGFKIKNLEEAIDLCRRHNVIVVEDCAHLYNYNAYNFSDAGVYGDFAFYSLHKFFPIESGGLYIQNNLNLKKPDSSKLELHQDYASFLIKYNVQGIANKRIENFKLLDSLLKNINELTSLKTLSKGDIPHNYPILVKNQLREKLYFWLIEHDITLIALYYRLIDPVLKGDFETMHKVSNSILNLPIHQDISKDDLILITNKMKEFYGK